MASSNLSGVQLVWGWQLHTVSVICLLPVLGFGFSPSAFPRGCPRFLSLGCAHSPAESLPWQLHLGPLAEALLAQLIPTGPFCLLCVHRSLTKSKTSFALSSHCVKNCALEVKSSCDLSTDLCGGRNKVQPRPEISLNEKEPL